MAEIGSTLREARMRARIDISEVEARTKIRAKYLRAIENEEWDLLPGSVYVKSFLRTYGDFLGLDSRLLVDEFKRRYERPMEYEARPMAQAGRDRGRAPSRFAGALFSPRSVIVLAIAVIVAALYVIGSQSGTHNTTDGGKLTPANTNASDSHTPHRNAGSSTRSATTTATTTTATTTTPVTATLALVPTAPIWVCVEGPGGKLLIPGLIYDAGAKVPTQSDGVLLVGLGNSHADVTINGKPYPLGGADAIGLKVTPTSVTSLPAPPTCQQ
jgi:cytoskeleton protein RodZ